MNVFFAILDVDKARELVAGKVIKCALCGQDIAVGFPMDVANHVEIHIGETKAKFASYEMARERRLFEAKNIASARYGLQARWYGTLVETLVNQNQIDWKLLIEQRILVPVVGRG